MTRVTADIAVVRAGEEPLGALPPIFDGYREFYGQPSDTDWARAFPDERLHAGDSTIFLALVDVLP